jgi:hypothetical protein
LNHPTERVIDVVVRIECADASARALLDLDPESIHVVIHGIEGASAARTVAIGSAEKGTTTRPADTGAKRPPEIECEALQVGSNTRREGVPRGGGTRPDDDSP